MKDETDLREALDRLRAGFATKGQFRMDSSTARYYLESAITELILLRKQSKMAVCPPCNLEYERTNGKPEYCSKCKGTLQDYLSFENKALRHQIARRDQRIEFLEDIIRNAYDLRISPDADASGLIAESG